MVCLVSVAARHQCCKGGGQAAGKGGGGLFGTVSSGVRLIDLEVRPVLTR